jgi:hypothetical protein
MLRQRWIPPHSRAGHFTSPRFGKTRWRRTLCLLSWDVAGDSRGEAERNEHATGDVPLAPRPAGMDAQAVSDGPSEKSTKAITDDSYGGEKQTEKKNLCSDWAARRVDELKKKSKEEQRRLRVEYVHDDALAKDPAQRAVRGDRRLELYSPYQGLIRVSDAPLHAALAHLDQ